MSSVTALVAVLHGRARAAATATLLILAAALLTPGAIATDQPDGSRWVGTWSASPEAANAPIHFDAQTIRQIVHTSLGGNRVRVRLSNAYGTESLVIGAAHVAISVGGAAIFPGTDRVLTFNGQAGITIPGGAVAVSDSITLNVPALTDLAVSLYLPADTAATTQHSTGLQTNYISGPGNFTAAANLVGTATDAFYFMTGVEVRASRRARAIVALGDSVTDGFGSTPNMNQRFPNLLAARLQSRPNTSHIAVLNAGLSGNRILHDFVGTGALARLDRDVLVQTGSEYVIVLQGNADIVIPSLIGNTAEVVSVDQIIQGHRQIVDRAHALGLKAYGGTLNPVEGFPFPGFWTADMETKRQAINNWIRTSKAYDAVIDFDRVLRDPSHPSRLLPDYDSGDHVHPNDVGYQAMADAIDVSLFRGADQD
jgi:lysophospholipase L1-like esterase